MKHKSLSTKKLTSVSEVVWLLEDKFQKKKSNIWNRTIYLLNPMNIVLELKRELVNCKINKKISHKVLQRDKDIKNMRI